MEDLSLHILDIAENSIAAGASIIEIGVSEDTLNDTLSIEVKDNGRGMDKETLKRVTDPFYTTKTVRKVGLGIPFLKQAAEECEGTFSLTSQEGTGTRISATFRSSHIDRKPLGDIGATLMVLIAGSPDLDFTLWYKKDTYQYTIDTVSIKKDLDGVPINTPQVLQIIRDDITKGLLV